MKKFLLWSLAVIAVLVGAGLDARGEDPAEIVESETVMKALRAYSERDMAKAIFYLRKEIKDNPTNGYANLLLGIIHSQIGEYSKALEPLNNALTYIPADDKKSISQALDSKGEILIELGDSAKAFECFDQAISLKPDNANALLNRANAYHDKRDYDRADKDYAALCQLMPTEPKGYLGLARNNLKRDNYNGALSILNDAIELIPNDGNVYLMRAEAYFLLNKLDDAVDDLLKGISCDNNEAATNRLLSLTDEPREVLKRHLLAKAEKSTDSFWYGLLGMYLQEDKEYNKAIDCFYKANALADNHFYHLGISECYFNLGDNAKALDAIDKAIELYPLENDLINLKLKILDAMEQ